MLFNVVINNMLLTTEVKKLFLLPNVTRNDIKTLNGITYPRDTAIHFVTVHYLIPYV